MSKTTKKETEKLFKKLHFDGASKPEANSKMLINKYFSKYLNTNNTVSNINTINTINNTDTNNNINTISNYNTINVDTNSNLDEEIYHTLTKPSNNSINNNNNNNNNNYISYNEKIEKPDLIKTNTGVSTKKGKKPSKNKNQNFKNIVYNKEEQIINFDNFQKDDLNKFLLQDNIYSEDKENEYEITYINTIYTKGTLLNIENMIFYHCTQFKLRSSNLITKLLNVKIDFI